MIKRELQAQSEEEMIYHRERGFSILFAHSEEKRSESIEIHTRIEKYIYRSQSTTQCPYTQEERLIIDSYDSKWLYLSIGKHISLYSDTFSRYMYMRDRVTIDLVEEIDTGEEDDDDTQEIRTEEEAHNHHRDDDSRSDCIPFSASFEFVFKCPRKFFHRC